MYTCGSDGALDLSPGFVLSGLYLPSNVPDVLRLLHQHSEMGYTQVPALAVLGEPEAVSALCQQRLSTEARERRLAPIRVREKTLRLRIQAERDRGVKRGLAQELEQVQRRIAGTEERL